MIFLSIFPGLGYIFLGYMNDIVYRALFWYALILINSLWGVHLYNYFKYNALSEAQKQRWYLKLRLHFYLFFSLWTLIFLLYNQESQSGMHYIALFTQIGSSVVAASLLVADRRLFIPVLLILIVPLSLFFVMLNTWYGYVLTIFSGVFFWVLLYSANSSHKLLVRTRNQSIIDELTQLFNRYYILEKLNEFQRALKDGSYGYILLIDLDHIKSINDTLGHSVGDSLLKEVAQRMKLVLDTEHYIGRLGGDEFVVVSRQSFAQKSSAMQRAKSYASELLHSIKAPMHIDAQEIFISASVGANVIVQSQYDAQELIKEADLAMYEVKQQGRDGVMLFDEQMNQSVVRHMQILTHLSKAIEREEIHIELQPQMNKEGQVVSCEALARWHDATLGTISPAEFIKVAEHNAMMMPLGYYLIEQSLKLMQHLANEHIAINAFAINISMRQLFHPEFIARFSALLEVYRVRTLPIMLVLEITETVEAEDTIKLQEVISLLKDENIEFSLDDFGTGFSSLALLHQLKIDELKIDQHFVQSIVKKETKMVDAIIAIAQAYAVRIVAEGVEDEQSEAYLIAHGVEHLQGFYYSKSLRLEPFIAFVQQHNLD